MPADPLLPFLQQRGVMLLDGGLATEMEARGRDLDRDLWSAGELLDESTEAEQAGEILALEAALTWN